MEFDISKIGVELQNALTRNAPVRTKPPSGPHGQSPYPGNLQQNGINITTHTSNHIKITIGGDPAPYAPYTETKSHKPYWMAKSVNEVVNLLVTRYGGVVR